MKKLSYVFLSLIFFSSIFLVACVTKNNEVVFQVPDKTHTLIFIDKTASVDVSTPFVAEKFKKILNDAIQSNINIKGDKFDVYFIHENTSKGQFFGYTCKAKNPEIEGVNTNDAKLAIHDYESKINKERSKVFRMASNALMNKNTSTSNLETNILASIPVIAQVQAGEAERVQVYYLSDMIESVKNGRDFQKKAPKDEEEAKNWAIQDFEKINRTQIELSKVSVSMILPFDATASSKINNPTISIYWKTLFEKLGVSSFEEK